MSTLQSQARALGDPTRYAVFQYLADASAAVDVAELTDHFGLNHPAIRQHLAKWVDAELVLQSTAEPAGRGRPKLQYTLNPGVDSRWGATGPYERLSMLLTEVVRSGDSPLEVGRRAGRRQRLGESSSSEPVSVLMDQMARQGFDPALRQRGDEIDVTLQACPFASAVLTDADTICELHLGLATGVAESVGGIEIQELVPRDPRQAHCHLRCRVDEPDGA